MRDNFIARIGEPAITHALGFGRDLLCRKLCQTRAHAADPNARTDRGGEERLAQFGILDLELSEQRLPRACDNLFMRPLLPLLARIHAAVSRGRPGSQKWGANFRSASPDFSRCGFGATSPAEFDNFRICSCSWCGENEPHSEPSAGTIP